MCAKALELWVLDGLSTARMFGPVLSVDVGGLAVDERSFKTQPSSTIVHNPHAYFLLLPNPSQSDKEMWNDEISM